MSKNKLFDIAIIGGGITGAATGMSLCTMSNASIVLLEAENKLAAHQTGNNSGVIHSGLYYKPGSLKAENCAEGRNALYDFCKKHKIPHERCGKIVVATNKNEISALDELEKRGKENGLHDIKRIGPKEIERLEPHVKGIDGLHVPQTGIVDFNAVTLAYGKIIKENGSEILLNSKVVKVTDNKKHLTLFIKNKHNAPVEIKSKYLINCAGLQCDRVAKMCGVAPDLKIVPFRGEYYQLNKDRQSLVKNLIYPVPDARFPFLGVHFTKMISGGVEAGPNAVLSLKREGYSRFAFSFTDVCSYLFYKGFWKMALKFWKTGINEVWRSLSKKSFVNSLCKLMPQLTTEDVHRAGAGVRAQALLPNGKLCDDFKIVETKNMIHVLNAPSPAATASIAIGKNIAQRAIKNFVL